MTLFLKNANFIDAENLKFTATNIKVEEGIEGKISFVDNLNNEDLNNKENKIIDCKGKIVTHAFACGHHHVYSALARGMGAPKKSPVNFYEVLQYIWWTLDKALDADSIKASAYATAMACAKNGVTFVIDHHASPFKIENSLSILAEAFDKVGVSHLLCYEITDRDGLDKANEGLKETELFLQKNQGLVGLHASFTVSDKTLDESVALAKMYNSGIHVHVAEDAYDQKHCMENYGKRVTKRLKDMGALDFSKTILGHCIHIDEVERKLIYDSPVYVAQNTESNLNNNVGFFKNDGLDINRIMLGTDGMHSDMLRSAKSTFYTSNTYDAIDYMAIYKRFRNVHSYIRNNNFKGDAQNNLVVMDYDTPTPINENNFLGHFLFGLESRQVQHVISNGKLIVEDKKLSNVNEEEILDFTKEQAVKLWERMKKI